MGKFRITIYIFIFLILPVAVSLFVFPTPVFSQDTECTSGAGTWDCADCTDRDQICVGVKTFFRTFEQSPGVCVAQFDCTEVGYIGSALSACGAFPTCQYLPYGTCGGSYGFGSDIYEPIACDAGGGGGGGPDFTISLSPGLWVDTKGDAETEAVYLVTLKALGGFSSSVSLTSPNCPSGADCTFDGGPTVTVSGSPDTKKLRVTGLDNLDPNPYTITARGVGGGLTRSRTANLRVNGSACDPTATGNRKFIGCYFDDLFTTDVKGSVPDGPQQALSGYNDTANLAINQDWGFSDPPNVTEPWSARWNGSFNFSGGDYIFDFTGLDDKARIWLDGGLVPGLDAGGYFWDNGAGSLQRNITIPAGVHGISIDLQEFVGAAVMKLSWSKVSSPPQAPSISFNSKGCTAGNASFITLNYAANMPPDSTRIELFRSGMASPVYTDNSPSASSRQYTDTGLTDGQSYIYSAIAYNGASASAPASTSPITASICTPLPSVSAQITLVNGSSSFNLRDIKDGDSLRFRVAFTNSGAGVATRVDNTSTLSGNLSYDGNSFSCAPQTALGAIMRCSPSSIGNPGSSSLTFHTRDPLNPGDTFYMDFAASVVTSTDQPKELLTVRSQGSYTPGSAPFDVTYSLLATPSSVVKPDFQEIAP